MTVKEMRDKLRELGAIKDRCKSVPLIHFLLHRYWNTTGVNYKLLVNATQGDNKEEIQEAERLLEEVRKAFEESEEKDRQAAHALREALSREAAARGAEQEAKAQEEAAIKAEHVATQREAAASKVILYSG